MPAARRYRESTLRASRPAMTAATTIRTLIGEVTTAFFVADQPRPSEIVGMAGNRVRSCMTTPSEYAAAAAIEVTRNTDQTDRRRSRARENIGWASRDSMTR